jgi:hypothetical protein
MSEPFDSHFQPSSSSQSTEGADSIDAVSSAGDRAGDRADLISRLQREMDHAIGGTSGLDRQDRLLKDWHEHGDSSDRDSSDDLTGGESSRVGAFHESMAPSETNGSNLDLERLPTGWPGLLEDGSDDSGVGIDLLMGGGLLRHGIHEWIGDPYQAPQITLSSDSGGDRASFVSSPDWVPPLGPVFSLLHRLQASHDSMGRPAPRILWIGHRCLPAPWNLLRGRRPIGFDIEACLRVRDDSKPTFQEQFEEEASEIDGRLLEHSLFVTPPRDDRQARRWCLEQAIRTVSIDAVVIDGSGFAPLDSRRLHVALAERRRRGESPLFVLMVRPPRDQLVRSSAITRWSVMPSANVCPSDPRIAAWSVQLLRTRMPQTSPSMAKAVIGLVYADWDLASVVPSQTACPAFISSTSSSLMPFSHLIGSIEKEPHVDTPSVDPIPLAGDRSGSPSTSSWSSWSTSSGRTVAPAHDGLFKEIIIPEERSRRRFSHRTRRGIPQASTDSGGWDASRLPAGDRMLFSGESARDPQGNDAHRGEGADDVGDRGKTTLVVESR